MKKKLLCILTTLTVGIIVNSSELPKWPKWSASDANAINRFIEFYNKELKNISVSLTVSNGTKDTVKFGSKELEPGATQIIKPVGLTIEPLRSGAIFEIKTPSGSNLGVFAVHIESRGWPISRFPSVYSDPKMVPEKATATLLVGGNQQEAFVVREFDIFKLKKALIDINLSLRGDQIGNSSISMSVNKE